MGSEAFTVSTGVLAADSAPAGALLAAEEPRLRRVMRKVETSSGRATEPARAAGSGWAASEDTRRGASGMPAMTLHLSDFHVLSDRIMHIMKQLRVRGPYAASRMTCTRNGTTGGFCQHYTRLMEGPLEPKGCTCSRDVGVLCCHCAGRFGRCAVWLG